MNGEELKEQRDTIVKLIDRELRLRKAVDWACAKLDADIDFRKKHTAAVDLEECVCMECDATAFADVLRHRAGLK